VILAAVDHGSVQGKDLDVLQECVDLFFIPDLLDDLDCHQEDDASSRQGKLGGTRATHKSDRGSS
jgi:hypothetical protein